MHSIPPSLLPGEHRSSPLSPRTNPLYVLLLSFLALPHRQDRDREIFETRLRSRALVRIRITISCLELLRSRFQRSIHEIEKFQFNRARFKPRFFRYRNVDGRLDNTADVVRGGEEILSTFSNFLWSGRECLTCRRDNKRK